VRARRDERAWLSHIRGLWGRAGLAPGHGDDVALLPSAPYAVTTDFLAESRDFERGWAPWEAVGYKALAVNLSDLSASGARPAFFFLTLAWAEDLPDRAVERLLEGMHALSRREGCLLAGGDLSGCRSGLCISITAVGFQEEPPLLRSGGKPGDLLFVSGHLGGPRAALSAFRAGARLRRFDLRRAAEEPAVDLLDRFFRPPSQTALGQFLARSGACTACMDLSDGLAADLPRLCEASGCGAVVDAASLPLQPGMGRDACDVALAGGEEQVLLFAVRPEAAARLGEAPAVLFPVGTLTAERGVRVRRDGRTSPLRTKGFDHFSR